MKLNRLLLSLIAILAAAASAQTPHPRYTNTAARMTAFITNQMAEQGIVGMGIALLESNTTVWARGFGWADREAGIPVGTGTVFRIGSVSKVFGTTALLKLWEQGHVDLDAPITNYIPDFATLPRFSGAAPITTRMLLAHQSGLPGDILAGMFTVEPSATGFLEWLQPYLRTDYPAYRPSFVSVYCNSGFTISEGIVRAASGMDFTDYAQAAVFGPLGMQHSSYLVDRPAISNNLARPYIGGMRAPDEYVGSYATGSMLSSMPDLLRYLRMVNAGGMLEGTAYLTTNALAEMTADTSVNCPLNLMSDGLCGLGWDFIRWYQLDYAGRVWIKSGGTFAYTAYIIALPDQQLGVAVAANSSCSLFDIAVNALRWAVLDKTGGALHWPTNTFIPPSSPITNRAQDELNAMAGIYVTGDGLDRVTAGEGVLTWTAGIDTAAPAVHANLAPRANGWFSAPDSQTLEITITNVTGETVLLSRAAKEAYQHTLLKGQRYTPAAIPAAWSNRMETLFLIDDIHPLDYMLLIITDFAMHFSKQFGILHHASGISNGWLDPRDGDTAFVLGLQNRGPAAVLVAHTNGAERLQCGGYHFIDAASRPAISPGSVSAGTLPDAGRTAWYRTAVKSGLDYLVRLQSSDGCTAVFCDPAAALKVWAYPATGACWRADTNGTAYIGIYGDGQTAGSYVLNLTIASHGGHDFDGDGKADPALAQGAALTAWLSGANYAPFSMNLGDPGRAMLAADVDGDGKADPVVVQTDGAWKIWFSTRNYAAITMALGTTAGTPLLADCDGDGKADPLLVLPGRWYAALSTENYAVPYSFDFGLGAGMPAAADFDGDGKADLTMVNGTLWTAALSGSGYALNSLALETSGAPCPGDYDGDGLADPAVFNNGWYVWLSGDSYRKAGPFFSGVAGIPVP